MKDEGLRMRDEKRLFYSRVEMRGNLFHPSSFIPHP
jgi:hypothetical protein